LASLGTGLQRLGKRHQRELRLAGLQKCLGQSDLRSLGIARPDERLVVADDRLVDGAHLQQCVPGGDERTRLLRCRLGGTPVNPDSIGKVVAGLGRRADPHQHRIGRHWAATVTAIDVARIESDGGPGTSCKHERGE